MKLAFTGTLPAYLLTQFLDLHVDMVYGSVLQTIYENGYRRYNERTGLQTRSISGISYRLSLSSYPILQTKYIPFEKVVAENLWFLSGSRNIEQLRLHTKIWDDWADVHGNIPSAYGRFWRSFPGFEPQYGEPASQNPVDQIKYVCDLLKKEPGSRRGLVLAWHPANATKSYLPPCHFAFQVLVQSKRLDLILYQRSADYPVGVPWNLAGYAIIAGLIAKEVGVKPGFLIHHIGDAHIYENQFDGVEKHLERIRNTSEADLKRVKLILPDKPLSKLSFQDLSDFKLENYDPQPPIKIPVAV